jgi:hypothetical protein
MTEFIELNGLLIFKMGTLLATRPGEDDVDDDETAPDVPNPLLDGEDPADDEDNAVDPMFPTESKLVVAPVDAFRS